MVQVQTHPDLRQRQRVATILMTMSLKKTRSEKRVERMTPKMRVTTTTTFCLKALQSLTTTTSLLSKPQGHHL